MPEGDSIFKLARRVRPVLEGRVLTEGRLGREQLPVLTGATVERVETYGKHLLLHLDTGRTLRVHLGLGGKGLVIRGPYDGRRVLDLATDAGRFVVTQALHCQLLTPAEAERALAHLGPDLLKDPCDLHQIAEGSEGFEGTSSELLLDQRIAAGIGNVYKCELLFVFRIHPERPASEMPPLQPIYAKARDWLRANCETPRRITTGPTFPADLYVYDRARRPCMRCRTPIAVGEVAERVTYWCPKCQVR